MLLTLYTCILLYLCDTDCVETLLTLNHKDYMFNSWLMIFYIPVTCLYDK